MGNRFFVLIVGCITTLYGLNFVRIAIKLRKQGKEFSLIPGILMIGFGIFVILYFLFTTFLLT